MKNLLKVFLFVVLLNIAAKATAGNNNGNNHTPATDNGDVHDSTIGIKSNIVIFKIIATPAPATGSSGSLRKAGKAARTSNTHTSIDFILDKNKGI